MKISGEQLIPASREAVWEALNDPEILKQSIAGCTELNKTSETEFDAEVTLWVVKTEYDKGLDSELFEFSKSWIKKAWPFKRVAFPGRDMSWDAWAALPEA